MIEDLLLTKVFGNTLFGYLMFLIFVVSSVVLTKIIYILFKTVIRTFSKNTKTQLDDIIVDIIEKPLLFIVLLTGIYAGLGYLILPVKFEGWLIKIYSVLTTFAITWFISLFVDALVLRYLAPLISQSKSEFDDQLLPIIKKVAQLAIWSSSFLFILGNLGYNISSLIAGLGIGGIAVALALKDILSHFFGGVTVLTDKPFKIGDRVRLSGHDGRIEEIGVRSIKLRTLDGTMVIMPNGVVAESVIENVSREKSRKVKMYIGLEYGTTNKKMEQGKELIRKVIIDNKRTDEKALVFFNEFADFSLNLIVIYWITDLDNILEVKDEINMEIKAKLEKVKVEMAFPTQTIHLKK